MNIVRTFLFVLLPASLLVACDGGGGSGTGGSGASAGSGGSGGSGGSTETGGGGSGGGQGGSGGGVTTTSEGGSGGMATTGSTTGSTTSAMGACTNAEDSAVLNDPNKDFEAEVNNCAQTNLGQEPATYDCIKAIGFTDGCAQCFDDTVQCVIMNCLTECLSGPDSQACTDCRAMKCDPAFETCSGLTVQ